MIKTEPEKNNVAVCDLSYLSEMMGNKTKLMREIMDVFLKQVPEELKYLQEAVSKSNYAGMKTYAHTMKSSVSIMGITSLVPHLQAMENIGSKGAGMEESILLNEKVRAICKLAIEEIESAKHNYV